MNSALKEETMTQEQQSSFTRDELLACGRGELPNQGDGRLPLPNMLMMDRITLITNDGGKYKKGYIEAELDIDPSLWYFECHFQGDPVMPGCLGLDAMWQLVGFCLSWRGNRGKGRALGCGEVKFRGQVLPDSKKVTYKIHIRRVAEQRLVMGIADATMEVDGREIYAADNLRVGLFASTDDF